MGGGGAGTGFDSKLVRLKAKKMKDAQQPFGDLCFDSKLVRLKAITRAPAIVLMSVFRFQTGSIKRKNGATKTYLDNVKFRFQTGSIKS